VRPGITDSEAAKRRVQYQGKDRHVADLKGEGDACYKAFSIKAGLTQGVFNVVCPDVITLGFRCLLCAESVGDALSIVLERFSKLPKAIIYDVVCKLDKNAMRRVRKLMRAQGVRCILDRPHSITHSCSLNYMPDECLGTTAGVATQAAEVSHSIAVVNRTSPAYMSPSTYMYHRTVQMAFIKLRKLYRLHAGSGAGENDHLTLAPFFHAKIMHKCERVTVCTCASAACTDGGQDAGLDEAADAAAPAMNTDAVARQASGAVEAVIYQGLGDGTANVELAEADRQVEQEPWGFEIAEASGAVQVDNGAGRHEGGGDKDVVGLAVDKADRLTMLRHMELLAQFHGWAAARSSRNDLVLDTSPIPRAQRKLVDELTDRPLSKV